MSLVVTEEPQPQAWPKPCTVCKRTFDQQQWNCLTLLGYAGAVRSGGKLHACELRLCTCTTTLAVEVELPLGPTFPPPYDEEVSF